MKKHGAELFLPLTLGAIIALAVSLHTWATTLPVWHQWQQVGRTTLTWGFWDIYDAELRTPSGNYNVADPYAADMALIIDYRRTISKKQLLEATDKQWQHLQVTPHNRARWIKVFDQLWQGVRKGDRLVFMLTRSGGVFYSGNRLLGRVDNPVLARSFLAIWLSEDTSYPTLRRQLLGQSGDNRVKAKRQRPGSAGKRPPE